MAGSFARKTNRYDEAIRRLRGTFLLVGVFSAVINLLMMTGPIYMLQVYDRVLSSGSVPTLFGLFMIVIILYAFLGLYDLLRARMLSRAGLRLDAFIGGDAFRQAIEAGGTGGRGRREVGLQPVRDVDLMRGFLSSPAVSGLFDMPWMPLFLVVVFLIHPWLGYLTLGGAAVLTVAAILNQAQASRSIQESMAMEGAERALLEQARRETDTIEAMGMKDRLTARWRALHDMALGKAQVGGERSEFFAAFSRSFRLLLQSALLTLGALLALRQEISPGMIIAISILAGRALAPVDQVVGQWRVIGRAREAHRRLRELFEGAATEPPRVRLPPPAGALQVTRLTKLAPGTYSPTQERPRILDQVSFVLEPGDGLGVLGNSAAGKSTLARLLVGAWTPDAGEIRLDAATLDQWSAEDKGAHLGYLPQTLRLLPGTVAENIARFDPQARDPAIIEAARLAGVHEMILKLPNGYATEIGTMRQPLSGGQIQRLGLARALYGTPRLVVLDEPNSNLDADGDEALAHAIRALRERDSIVVVMAHRPSAIAAVNKVLVLHQGRMAQFGDKSEVLRQPGRPVSVAAQ